MRVPSNVLRKIRRDCSKFAGDESGTGISDYGVLFALLMMVAGIGSGWYLISCSPKLPAGRSAVELKQVANPKPVQNRFDDPCLACGMG